MQGHGDSPACLQNYTESTILLKGVARLFPFWLSTNLRTSAAPSVAPGFQSRCQPRMHLHDLRFCLVLFTLQSIARIVLNPGSPVSMSALPCSLVFNFHNFPFLHFFHIASPALNDLFHVLPGRKCQSNRCNLPAEGSRVDAGGHLVKKRCHMSRKAFVLWQTYFTLQLTMPRSFCDWLTRSLARIRKEGAKRGVNPNQTDTATMRWTRTCTCLFFLLMLLYSETHNIIVSLLHKQIASAEC